MRAWSGIVWRGAALGAALTVVALTIGSPAWADDASLHLADGGDSGLLGPFNVKTADGLRLDKYELTGGGDGVEDTTMRFLMSGLFALSRTIVGACCWLVDWVYRYPVLEKLIAPAQAVSDAYQEHVVEPLGIAPLFLAWAFAVGLIMVMRGRPGRGFGEIGLTLLISAMTASVLVRPDVLLGYDGPVQQVQRASLEAAVITANSGRETGDRDDPCDLVAGPAQRACRDKQPADDRDAEEVERAKRRQDCEAVSGPARDLCLSGKRAPAAKDVSEPITRILTDVLVVQPHQLLQFGQLFERGTSIHRDYVKGLDYKFTRDEDDPCRDLGGVAEEYCPNSDGISPEEFEDGKAQSELMEKHGEAGKVAISYMNSLSWDRVLGALFLLIAVCVLALVVLSMAVVMLATQFSAAVAAGHPLSIAFVDLDDFKQINDRHGHLVGDQVLRQFAQTLQRMLRSTDLVARYGGEEFLVVLRETALAAAQVVIRRILDEVARTPMAIVDGKPLYVTFSAGLATQGEHERFENARQLLDAADQALYGAKREGRNRVAAPRPPDDADS